MTQKSVASEIAITAPDISYLRALEDARPLYILPSEPLADEVLIPAFRAASRVDCMVGFFSSQVLADLAPGLAAFVNHSNESFRLIISPFLRSEDQKVIEDGVKSAEEVASQVLAELIVTEDLLQQHTLKCMSHLLRIGRIDIKIALMKDALFHPKVWMFEDSENIVAAHGSSNMTQAGIKKNFEQITVSKSWEDPNQRYIIKKLQLQFARLWDNTDDVCEVITLPNAVKENILRSYPTGTQPTEADFDSLFQRATGLSDQPQEPFEPPALPEKTFKIPDWLSYEDGPFEHQGRAVRSWCEAGFRGVLEMATGSGKTLTSMICAYNLYEIHHPLLIVVAAPYVPLIEQWCEEITPFGLTPVNLTTAGGAQQRSRALQQVKRRLRTGISEVEAIVVSHDTLCSEAFLKDVESFNCNRLLIADEAHNLGRQSFINDPPEFFEHRLALSATPIRQYDAEGTDALFAFFGPVVFQFTLEEAIGRCLVEYEYYVHPVSLTPDEMDEWYELTNKIKQNAWRQNRGKPEEYLAKLLRDRRALLETAEGKIAQLSALLEKEDKRNLKHTLIYATDKAPAQLETVNNQLRDKGILFHQLTAEETANRALTKRVIRSFQDGEIQVLTAKRVLDEGVNIPQICKAFILASTTVERQWIQRRGRLLRTCEAIGKTHSIVHDFLALPPVIDEGLDKDARSLVRSELKRSQEFARLAKNAGKADGPLAVIDGLVDAAYL